FAVGMNDNPREIVNGWTSAGVVADFNVPKSVKRESRLEEFLVATLRCVVIRCTSAAQGSGVGLAVFVEHLNVSQVNRLSRRGVPEPQPHPADHVLAHVKDVTALVGGDLRRGDRLNLLNLPDRRGSMRDDLNSRIVEHNRILPS